MLARSRCAVTTTQQQEKDIVRKTRVLEDRLVNNLKNKGEDQFISKTEKAGEFIQRNEKASNVLDTAIKVLELQEKLEIK